MATARPRPQVMRLTDAAADRIKAIMAKADKPFAGVRVGVKNGGCAGMAYTMEYAESAQKFDEVVEDKGVKLLIDPKAVHVPARHRDGLQGRQAVLDLRVQQSEPDLGLRLRRVGAADAGLRSGEAPRRTEPRVAVDAEAIGELFREFGPVSVRRMFGGAGIFVDGLMIGLVSDGVIYLKADAETIPAFEREGQGRSPTRRRTASTS